MNTLRYQLITGVATLVVGTFFTALTERSFALSDPSDDSASNEEEYTWGDMRHGQDFGQGTAQNDPGNRVGSNPYLEGQDSAGLRKSPYDTQTNRQDRPDQRAEADYGSPANRIGSDPYLTGEDASGLREAPDDSDRARMRREDTDRSDQPSAEFSDTENRVGSDPDVLGHDAAGLRESDEQQDEQQQEDSR